MPRKRTGDKTPPAAGVTGVDKPKRASARSATTRHTTRAQAAAASISHPAGLDPGDIARLAYGYWEARGGRGGTPEQDWHRAEQELRERCAVASRG